MATKKITPAKMKKATPKKATAKQLEAHKKFAKMAMDGTLAKKRAATSKKKKPTPVKPKKGLKGSLPKGMTKAVAKNIKIEGLSKTTGRLLKGYYYGKGGKIIKTKAKLESERKCKTKK
jgi:hypothetical protein